MPLSIPLIIDWISSLDFKYLLIPFIPKPPPAE
jgi:hypothetical protein